MSHEAILLPGAVAPAEIAYAPLLEALIGEHVDAVAKDLEIYATDEPPASYSLDLEIEGILRIAETAGFERLHLVGYSGGGGSAVAFTARHPDRVRSLALLEPAWIGNHGLSLEEQRVWREFDKISVLPPAQVMPAFIRTQLAAGVDPPRSPPGPPPQWMAQRPAGIAALTAAFANHRLNPARLRGFHGPVYYALGARSNPDYYGRMAERAAQLFADFHLEVFEDRHHFDPPHRVEPERLARSLKAIWECS